MSAERLRVDLAGRAYDILVGAGVLGSAGAEIAARTAEEKGEIRVEVIASKAQVHGLAAMAVHEPGRTFDQFAADHATAFS